MKSADDQPSNIDWVISNDEDAAAGLKDGTYTAVVTIPENFTAASLSTRPGETPEKATIGVQTAPNARVVDGAITGALASTASQVYGSTLSSQYLKKRLPRFHDPASDQLGSAASGAHQLADGASQAHRSGRLRATASGSSRPEPRPWPTARRSSPPAPVRSPAARPLSSGAGALAGGTRSAAAGVTKLADGNAELAKQINALAAQIPPHRTSPRDAQALSTRHRRSTPH